MGIMNHDMQACGDCEIHLYVDELNEMAATLTVMECLIERENER